MRPNTQQKAGAYRIRLAGQPGLLASCRAIGQPGAGAMQAEVWLCAPLTCRTERAGPASSAAAPCSSCLPHQTRTNTPRPLNTHTHAHTHTCTIAHACGAHTLRASSCRFLSSSASLACATASAASSAARATASCSARCRARAMLQDWGREGNGDHDIMVAQLFKSPMRAT